MVVSGLVFIGFAIFFTIVGLQATGLDDVRVHLDIPWPGGQAGSSINEFLWN